MKYSDIHPNFVDKIITDRDSIRNSIKNNLLINRYNLMSNIRIGSRVSKSIFKNMLLINQADVIQEIKTTLQRHEPRIKVLGVNVNEIENEININIVYEILGNLDDKQDSVKLRLGI